MKWGARQEEIPAPFSITGLAMSFRTQHPADRILSVCLQKRMLCARLKAVVAPVDLLLDLLGHGAVLLLQQMPGASHHTQPFCDRDFLIARSRIIIQRCDATFDFVERKIAAVHGGGNDAPLQIGLIIPVQRRRTAL